MLLAIDGNGRTTVNLGARVSVTVIRADKTAGAVLFGGLGGGGGGRGIAASVTHWSSHVDMYAVVDVGCVGKVVAESGLVGGCV